MPYKDPLKARIAAREYWRRKHANDYRKNGRPMIRRSAAKSYKQQEQARQAQQEQEKRE